MNDDIAMDMAARTGALMGVLIKHGRPTVRAATAALRRGEATADQQRIVAELLDAITERA